jgi:hypothetical protein
MRSLLGLLVLVSLAVLQAGETRAQIAGVIVGANCISIPESTTIRNQSGMTITLISLGSLNQPGPNEPFALNVDLANGASVTYYTGTPTQQPSLSAQSIYEDNAPGEGAQLITSVGTYVSPCGPSGGGGGNGPAPTVPAPQPTSTTQAAPPSLSGPSTGDGGLLR